MLWLFAQIWVWLIVAVALGVLTGWLFWARPVRRRVAEARAATPPSSATS